MNTHFYHSLISPVGELFIEEKNGYITAISFAKPSSVSCKETKVIQEAKKQLTEYFNKKRETFTLPLHTEGTEFRKRVWEALQTIPYGESCSYKDLGLKIGNAKACRAVGMANHHNPIMIVIPCHRVIGSNGELTGYAGGVDVKRFLLELESCRCSKK